jgi:hypothetical protein
MLHQFTRLFGYAAVNRRRWTGAACFRISATVLHARLSERVICRSPAPLPHRAGATYASHQHLSRRHRSHACHLRQAECRVSPSCRAIVTSRDGRLQIKIAGIRLEAAANCIRNTYAGPAEWANPYQAPANGPISCPASGSVIFQSRLQQSALIYNVSPCQTRLQWLSKWAAADCNMSVIM